MNKDQPKFGLPHPPSTSTLPQIAQLYASPMANQISPLGPSSTNHKPLQRSSNPFVQSNNSFTKSSDDLLRDYGLDFSKLNTQDGNPHALLAPRAQQPNALSMIGTSSKNEQQDFFADLDPLRAPAKTEKPKNNGISPNLPQPGALPSAPPRVKRQQNWTTFD